MNYKFFFQAVLFVCLSILFNTNTAFTQIRTSSGNIGINTLNALSPLSINSDGLSTTGINVTDVGITAPLVNGLVSTLTRPATVAWKYSVNGIIESGTGNAVGIRGVSITDNASTEGRSYGVYGTASNATSGYNYGVFGELRGVNGGTAVLGWDRINNPNWALNTNGYWAGYFVGKTCFTDTLQVAAGGLMFPDGSVQISANNPTMLARTIQEQQEIIELQTEELAIKAQHLNDLHNRLVQLEELMEQFLTKSTPLETQVIEMHQKAYINQNEPNPSQGHTKINYYVPESAKKAILKVTTVNGSVLNTYSISKGKGQLNINTQELGGGIYFYTLIVDGQPLESKEMIINN